MYVPRFNALDDDEAIRNMVRTIGAGDLVTVGEDGYPLATRLPVVWEGDRLRDAPRAGQPALAVRPS